MKRHVTRVADLLNPAAVLLPAANVIMQLSLPGVGYGVLESPVDSGNVYKHPFKRARTTGTYLAVATIGTESDRALIRDAVDTAHRQVRSTLVEPGVLQRVRPQAAAVGGRLPVPLLRRPARVPLRPARRRRPRMRSIATPSGWAPRCKCANGMWPPDRVAFDEYWKRSLEELRIDPPVREHLHGVAIDGVPAVAAATRWRGRSTCSRRRGSWPPEFRSMMQLEWTEPSSAGSSGCCPRCGWPTG